MPRRNIQFRKLRKSSVGDLRECISLEQRAIAAPSFDSASFTQDYEVIAEVWAKVETRSGQRTFDNVVIEDGITHIFTIRHRDDVTSETRVRYKGDLYRIRKTENLEERDEYIVLRCEEDGGEEQEANQ